MIELVRNEHDLADFRRRHGGRALLDRLPAAGAALVTWPVGVGKSHAIDDVIDATVSGTTPRFDLVVVLCARHAIIQERRHVRQRNPALSLKVIEPRPRENCGGYDDAWQTYEQQGLGVLGREQLCTPCPNRGTCDWPDQYTAKRLNGVRVVYATHTHLQIDPGFVGRLKRLASASKPLVIIDEADWLFQQYRYEIRRRDLERFAEVLDELRATGNASPLVSRWYDHVVTLAQARETDLAADVWRAPSLPPEVIAEVQRVGHRRYDGRFRFIGHAIEQFGRSPVGSRELEPSGAIAFTATPVIHDPLLIFSATLTPELLEWRLDRPVIDLFPDLKVFHEATHWVNLRSKLGTARHFPRNAPQILDFFAMLTSKRLGQGRRPLLVCRKQFVQHVIDEMTDRLRWLGHPEGVVVVPADRVDAAEEAGKTVIPVLHYGMVGINAFEAYDCCYCLTGYYVNGHAVGDAVQGLLHKDERVPLEVAPSGASGERVARAQSTRDRIYDHHRMAGRALEALEHATVIQTVGRVRPFTRPREVVTFQTADLPRVRYEREFPNLDQAREHFGIPTRRDLELALRTAETRRLIDAGHTTRQAAEALGVSQRTIQRGQADRHDLPAAWRSVFAANHPMPSSQS